MSPAQAVPATSRAPASSSAQAISGGPLPRFPQSPSLAQLPGGGAPGPSPPPEAISRSTARPPLANQLLTRMSTRRASRLFSGWIRIPSPALKAIVLPSGDPAVPPTCMLLSWRLLEGNMWMPSPPLPRSSSPAESVPTALPSRSPLLTPSICTPPRPLPAMVLNRISGRSARGEAGARKAMPQPVLGSAAD